VPVLLALALPAAFPAVRMGLKLPEPKSRWRALPIACVLYALIGIPIMLLMGARFGLNTDLPRAVYEASMPGLGEEIMYRGLMLMVLNEAFGRPWKLAGIEFGWGFVIISALFGIVHGIEVKTGAAFAVNFYWSAMIFPAATGVVLAWLRERTGSVWPSVLFHNFVNTLNDFLV
jgi:membrane protease YdiL (CAAX protease family)